MWLSVVSMIIFGLIFTAFFILVHSYTADEKAEIKSAYTKESVTAYPEELTDKTKDYIVGTSVLAEMISYPSDTYIKINGTVVSELAVSSTGDNYITYAKKYGTDLLENYVSLNGNYDKKVTLDGEGNVTGVDYTLVY